MSSHVGAAVAVRRGGGSFLADVVLALGVVLCLPFVILGIGLPIALLARLVLWIAGLF